MLLNEETKEKCMKIINALEIKENEKVLLHVFGEEQDFVGELKKDIEKKNGEVKIVYRSRENLSRKYAEGYTPDYSVYEWCDSVIDIFYYGIRPSSDFPADKMDEYRNEMMTIMRTLMSKEKFIQLRMPTEENAMEMGIDIELYKEVLNQGINVDYIELKKKTAELLDELDKYSGVEIKTGLSVLSLDFKDKSWFKDDGLGDLPAGEVYIAPNNANGIIEVPMVIVEGEKFENLVLTFEEGKLIKCSDEKLLSYIQSAPGDSDLIAEYGVGLNPNISKLTGYALFDEKMAGTVHIAVGMNSSFGGSNDTPLHLDFVVKGEVKYKL